MILHVDHARSICVHLHTAVLSEVRCGSAHRRRRRQGHVSKDKLSQAGGPAKVLPVPWSHATASHAIAAIACEPQSLVKP